jgi:multiple sugar transport system permease protein
MPVNTTFGRQNRVNTGTTYAALTVLTVLFILPIVWMILASFQTTAQIVQVPVHWVNWPPTFGNYPDVTQAVPLARYFANSLLLSGANVAGVLFSSTLVAYSFSRLR